MKLTKKQAIDLSIELWEWLAKTGELKWGWPEWKRFGQVRLECFLCEYVGVDKYSRHPHCEECPLDFGVFGCEENDKSAYKKWNDVETPKDRKKYAKLFLEQLYQLLEEK